MTGFVKRPAGQEFSAGFVVAGADDPNLAGFDFDGFDLAVNRSAAGAANCQSAVADVADPSPVEFD